MRLLKRARASYALSLILCAVLLGAMAVPAAAAKGDGRADAASHAEDNGNGNAKGKDKAPERSVAKGKPSSASSSGSSAKSSDRSASAGKSANASSQGQSASAGKSGDGSSRGQNASAAKSGNGSSASSPGKATERAATAEKSGKADSTAVGENGPAGNKGSMKVRPVGAAAHPPRNYAHLPCVVQVDFYGSPHSGAKLTAVSHPPTAPAGQTLLTATMTFSQSSPNPRGNELVGTTTLDFTPVVSGLSYHEQQGYHVKLTAVQDGPQGGDVKHKVFWIDCAPPAAEDTAAVSGEEVEAAQAEVVGSQAEVEVEAKDESVDAKVRGIRGGQERTRVAGVTVERGEAVTSVGARVLGDSQVTSAAAGRDVGALAATGVGVLVLALLALFALGGGAGLLRRLSRR